MQWPAGGSSNPQTSCFRNAFKDNYFMCSFRSFVLDLFGVFFELLTDLLPLHTLTGDFIMKLLQYGWQLGRDEQLYDPTRKLSWKSFSFWHCSSKTCRTASHENHYWNWANALAAVVFPNRNELVWAQKDELKQNSTLDLNVFTSASHSHFSLPQGHEESSSCAGNH